MVRIGGPIPDSYGLSLTVKIPTATLSAPVAVGTPLSWSNASAYSAVPAVAGGPIDLVTKEKAEDGLTPIGVHVFRASRVAIYTYSGTAPALGASIEPNGTGGVRTVATGNGTRVLYVDTTRSIVEVLMP